MLPRVPLMSEHMVKMPISTSPGPVQRSPAAAGAVHDCDAVINLSLTKYDLVVEPVSDRSGNTGAHVVGDATGSGLGACQ